MALARAKVAFFPESEKMTRKAGRPCVKIKRPVFLSRALSRITTRENFGAGSRSKEKKREGQREVFPSPQLLSTTFGCF